MQQPAVTKGLIVKAKLDQFFGRAPYGYSYDRKNGTIVIDPINAKVVTRAFELYATGEYTLLGLSQAVFDETGKRLTRSNLVRILKSHFYIAQIICAGREYKGNHPQLVDSATFGLVQNIMSARSKIVLVTRLEDVISKGEL